MKKINLPFIDLFAGCGGLSLGLEQAGFTPVYVNELNKDAMDTYLDNREEFSWLKKPEFHSYDIQSLSKGKANLIKLSENLKKEFNIKKGDLAVIAGGPPCQGYSGIGHRRSYDVNKKELPSNYLYKDMVKTINHFQPKMFLFENVRGLLSARWTKDGSKGEIFNDVIKEFSSLKNYFQDHALVYAKNYGVPQNRPRVLFVGIRKDLKFSPNNNDIASGLLPKPCNGYPNAYDLLSDLIDKNYEKNLISTNYITNPTTEIQKELRMKKNKNSYFIIGDKLSEQEYSKHSHKVKKKFTYMIKNSGKITSSMKTNKFAQRLIPKKWSKDGPNITATSLPDDYVHFSQPRSLTVREWARLQTFPDWYIFRGKRTTGGIRRAGNPKTGNFDRELPKYTQIGNAVPVKLAFEVGNHFSKILC